MKIKRPFLLLLLSASFVCFILLSIYLFISVIPIEAPSSLPKKIYPSTNSPKPLPPTQIKGRETRPKIAIIIDDLGYNPELASAFFGLDLALSFSILPSAPFTDVIVREANRMRREIILHQPMEPKDYPSVTPGQGALLLSMNKREIRQVLDRNLKQITGARGVNNHMGSSFTENREKMSLVLQELERRGLFYIDSRTTKGTVGFEQAKKIGLPAAERAVFLDNNRSPRAIYAQVERLIDLAKQSGAAIGIGHPIYETFEILEEYQSRLTHQCDIVPVSELIK